MAPQPDAVDYLEWLKTNPAPNLSALIVRYGGYAKIPAEAWAEWDTANSQWEAARRDRLLGSHTWALPDSKPRKRK